MSRAGRRVAVTGTGAVSAWGWGVEALWDGVSTGRTAIGPFDRIDHDGYETHVAAQVPPPSTAAPRKGSLADRFAVAAAAEAFRRAGLRAGAEGRRVGVWFGSSAGGMFESELFYARLRGHAAGRPSVALLASQQVSAPGEHVARSLGATGPVETASEACASGTLAIGAAIDAVRSGDVDVAVAGGAESLCRVTYGGFNALRAVSPVPCRPFRTDRQGLSIGEGAGVLVLEPVEAAHARGVRPLAEACGFGSSVDAHHMTAPDPEGEGAARALSAALADSGLAPASVDLINAHGTGTPLNDVAEWRAFETVFGPRAGAIPVVASKGSVGHLLGAAGAIEAVLTVECLERGAAHGIPGEGEIDAEAAVDLVTGSPRGLESPRFAVSLNLAFGGCNAAVVFRRVRGES